ncbi:basic helix-loop-helix (bHLH) DNA-binding superfamily protein [Euphorbia peplus]|nr:basic helix-loop-helix (bHLH) DNA-binding superfamily protein [Euphorbia peplus]
MSQNHWSSKPEKPSTTTMWSPPSSSPPQKTVGNNPSGLTRFGSAPGAFLARAVDSVIGPADTTEFSAALGGSPSMANHHQHHHHQYFSGDSSSITTESTCKVNSSGDLRVPPPRNGAGGGAGGLQRSYGFGEMSGSLVRQKSSPAGFLSHGLAENGFSITAGAGGYHNGSNSGHGVSSLKSQLSFTRRDSLSQISEESDSIIQGINSNNGHQNSSHSYSTGGFGMGSWDNTNSIVFSGPPSKRAKNIDGDFINCLGLETQFSLPQTGLEIATVENLLNIPEDSVPCKIRAKRGFATHPRSIAERERRTRISGRLKKLQDLVPNMDKQTSYSDMLDLAVQHIKGLQGEVQKLHKDLENCRCGCKPSTSTST